MEDLFKICRFRYKNRITLPLDVFARKEETADEIVSWWNKGLPKKHQWYKPVFGFKKIFYTTTPPYPLEQQQLECAEELYERRKRNCEKRKK